MKYFRYQVWDGYRTKWIQKLFNEYINCGIGLSKNSYIDMPFIGELKDGKYYDLITGEELIYCSHPYSGALSFNSYQFDSSIYIVSILKQLQREGINEYKREIQRLKELSKSIAIQERSYNQNITEDTKKANEFILEFVKKNR